MPCRPDRDRLRRDKLAAGRVKHGRRAVLPQYHIGIGVLGSRTPHTFQVVPGDFCSIPEKPALPTWQFHECSHEDCLHEVFGGQKKAHLGCHSTTSLVQSPHPCLRPNSGPCLTAHLPGSESHRLTRSRCTVIGCSYS